LRTPLRMPSRVGSGVGGSAGLACDAGGVRVRRRRWLGGGVQPRDTRVISSSAAVSSAITSEAESGLVAERRNLGVVGLFWLGSAVAAPPEFRYARIAGLGLACTTGLAWVLGVGLLHLHGPTQHTPQQRFSDAPNTRYRGGLCSRVLPHLCWLVAGGAPFSGSDVRGRRRGSYESVLGPAAIEGERSGCRLVPGERLRTAAAGSATSARRCALKSCGGGGGGGLRATPPRGAQFSSPAVPSLSSHDVMNCVIAACIHRTKTNKARSVL
jgi:hypothetical protein